MIWHPSKFKRVIRRNRREANKFPRRLNAASRNHVIRVLCRLLVDHTIDQNSHTILAIEEALEGLTDAIPEGSLDKDVGGSP